MNEKWTDFEKHVFRALERIETRLTRVEVRAAGFGVLGAVLVAAVKALWPS